MKFMFAKNYFPELFDFVVDSVRYEAARKPRTLKSRTINLLVNYYGWSLRKREFYYQANEDLFSEIKNKFEDNLRTVDVVSFDVFDTLLLRKVINPVDVFEFMEIELQAEGFFEARTCAERRARGISKKAEVTLDEIYAYMPLRFSDLLNEEKEFERRSLVANPFAMDLYGLAKNAGKRVIAVSDMYLDKKFLKEILFEQGYREIAEIFVSSEVGLTKSEGGLFCAVARNLNLNPRQFIHVGDNFKSDVKKSKRGRLGCNLVS